MSTVRPAVARARAPRRASGIRRAGALPYYAQLADMLRDHIARVGWRPGEALPSEAELCGYFSLSRTVVRQALRELAAEGLITTERGRGSFVAERTPPTLIFRGSGFPISLAGTLDLEVLTIDRRAAPAEIAGVLGPSPVHLVAVGRVHGDPVIRVSAWLRGDVPAGPGALAALLATDPAARTAAAVPAAPEVAAALVVAVGSPLLLVTALGRADDGASSWVEVYARADRAAFEAQG